MEQPTLQSNTRITPAQIDALMVRVSFIAEHTPGTTSTHVHAFLDGKFYLASGHSACVDPANFNAELGIKYAKQRAETACRDKLWELEGYALYKAVNEVAA